MRQAVLVRARSVLMHRTLPDWLRLLLLFRFARLVWHSRPRLCFCFFRNLEYRVFLPFFAFGSTVRSRLMSLSLASASLQGGLTSFAPNGAWVVAPVNFN